MSTREQSDGWGTEPPNPNQPEDSPIREKEDPKDSEEKSSSKDGLEPGDSWIAMEYWETVDSKMEREIGETPNLAVPETIIPVVGVSATSKESLSTDYQRSDTVTSENMGTNGEEVGNSAIEAVFPPMFRVVALTGAAISAFLLIASLLAGGYPLAFAFGTSLAFFVFAHQHGIE